MLTTHGVHEWKVVPGLQDTGGQNVFVNQFSSALEKFGYKITIVNRGGYFHPRTGEIQKGLHYKDEHQRILYLDDGLDQFVRKEDMCDRVPGLVQALFDFLDAEEAALDLIISHYWDAGTVGCQLKERLGENIKHIWVPHSLGAVKKRNTPPETWQDLRILDRITYEEKILNKIDYVAATSSIIRSSAKTDYGFKNKVLWLPPCVDQERYFPRKVENSDPVWSLLSDLTNLPIEEIQSKKIITEISRTDETKQKDILIRSFAQILENHPESLLVITIDDTNQSLSRKLKNLIGECGISHATAAVGSIWDILPALYAISDIYCTPSIMEGFGMAVQEAAATRVPVVSSDLVPFVTEYLAAQKKQKLALKSGTQILLGEGAIIVPPGNIEGFSFALDKLLSDENLCQEMGDNAYHATIPYFTWDHIVKDFILGIKSE
jgi:D-inositol-3-phosphate glycosyltransferase